MSKMNRTKEKERRARKLLKDQQTVDERAQREDLLIPEVEEDKPESLESEVREGDEGEIKKDYGDPMYYPEPVGPTSFEELDALRQAQEAAEEVQEVTYDVQSLVRNILWDPSMDPTQKAQKIQDVAGAFEERVSEALAEDSADMEKDMDMLELEAMLATNKRHAPILQGVGDLIKDAVTYGSRKAMGDSDFALVYTDKNGKKVRKYLIQDEAHVRNALARAAQQIKSGGAGAEDARKALPKIKAAAKKMGIGVEKGMLIEKDAKGDWRWIGRPSNNFIDWQTDIISKSAHQKYCAWLDDNPEFAPLFMKWHVPGTQRESPVDFWMEHEGALIMSGKLTETEAAQLFTMQKQVDLGMSVQGTGLRLNPEDRREVTDYWLFEVSDLPLDKAANPFTSLETITKEAGMDKLQYLTEMMGSKEKAEAFLQKTGQMQKQLQEAGITSKEKEVSSTQTQAQPPAEPAAGKTPDSLDSIVDRIKKEFDLDGLNTLLAELKESKDKVDVLEGVVKELQKSDDEKMADQLTPPAMRWAWSRDNRPSQSADTKLKKGKEGEHEEDESLSKALPTAHWLSEITNTAPIPTD